MVREAYTRQHQAAERVEMRRWLRRNTAIAPVMGQEPNHTELLMRQVADAGGDPEELMRIACERVDAKRCSCHLGSTCDVCHDPALCTCEQCTTAEAAAIARESA